MCDLHLMHYVFPIKNKSKHVQNYQGIGPSPSINVPVGPSALIVASSTIGLTPSDAGLELLLKSPTKSVLVEPGSAALMHVWKTFRIL